VIIIRAKPDILLKDASSDVDFSVSNVKQWLNYVYESMSLYQFVVFSWRFGLEHYRFTGYTSAPAVLIHHFRSHHAIIYAFM